MKSGLARLLNQSQPPVSYAPPGIGRGNHIFSLNGSARDPATFMRAYGRMGTLWSTVSLLSSSTARPEWRLYRKTTDNRVRYSTQSSGSDQRVEVVQHPALSVLNHPNDFWTRFELFEQFQQYLDLTGLNYMLVSYDAKSRIGSPLEIWPVRPDRIEPVPSPDSYLQGWIYHGPSGEVVPLNLNEVIPTRYPDPMDPYNGVGPVQSVMADIDSSQYSSEYNRTFFMNGASPEGIIMAPNKLTEPEWDEFSNRWRESHQGIAAAHRIAMLEGGMTYTSASVNAKDGDFTNLRNLNRDVVREAFGMHKVMLGVTDDVNRANAQTGEEVFYSWKIIPRLDRWKMVLNERFLPLFGAVGQNVEFDYIAPAPQNREQDNEELTTKAGAAQLLVNAGYDPHDVLEVVGLPDMDVAEKATQAPALPPGWVAPGAPAAAPGEPAKPADPGAGEKAAESAGGGDASNELNLILMNALPRLNGHKLTGVR